MSMMITYVNGYLCTSSCDVAKAKKGEDPHPSTDPNAVDSKTDKNNPTKLDATKSSDASSRADEPAVVFGGSLSELSASVQSSRDNAAAKAAAWQSQKSLVDLLV